LATADGHHFGTFLFDAWRDTDLSTPQYLQFIQPFLNMFSIDVSEDLSPRTMTLFL
jgi:hypothetical protein